MAQPKYLTDSNKGYSKQHLSYLDNSFRYRWMQLHLRVFKSKYSEWTKASVSMLLLEPPSGHTNVPFIMSTVIMPYLDGRSPTHQWLCKGSCSGSYKIVDWGTGMSFDWMYSSLSIEVACWAIWDQNTLPSNSKAWSDFFKKVPYTKWTSVLCDTHWHVRPLPSHLLT